MLSCSATDVVRGLLSRDPARFNSTINAHFASSCTYQGRGLKITGASQLKHASYLLNALDFGSAAKIDDEEIRWDAAGTTAVVKATRNVRPAFFPLFSFAVPTKLVLSFNAEEGAKDKLYCTQWRDEWPLEEFVQSVPLIGMLYRALVVPVLTMIFLWVSSVAFWVHSKVGTVERRYLRDASQVYEQKVQPSLPPALVRGFDTGVHTTEHVGQQVGHIVSRIAHSPLALIEELARTATVIVNLALPDQLQLPYPSVFDGRARSRPVRANQAETSVHTSLSSNEKSAQKADHSKPTHPKTYPIIGEGDGSQSPRKKVSGSPHLDRATTEAPTTDDAQPDTSGWEQDNKREAEGSHPEEPSSQHAKVVVRPSEDGSQAKEIDVVTQQVTEQTPPSNGESAKESLYEALKKDDQLPKAEGGASGGKKGHGKKKQHKNGGGKK